MTDTPKITITGNDWDVVILASGSLDLTNAQELRAALTNVSATAESINVDFRGAIFIDTAILEYLARAARDMLRRDKRLKVTVLEGSQPERVLRISGFGGVLDIAIEPAESSNKASSSS